MCANGEGMTSKTNGKWIRYGPVTEPRPPVHVRDSSKLWWSPSSFQAKRQDKPAFCAAMAPCNVSFLLGLSVLCPMLSLDQAFPTGSPASACESMLPLHKGAPPQSVPAPYEFLVSTPSFLNGQPLYVQILGPAYTGLLLQARSFGSPTALGFWETPPNNTKLLQCFGNPQGAITHSNTHLKTQQTMYAWFPPNSGCPKVISFVATVAQSHNVYWTHVKSKVVWRNPKATCGAESLLKNLSAATALACLLLLLLQYL